MKKNKEFIIRYFNAISGVPKPVELCLQFTTDQRLIEHIQFWDGAFPGYELIADEIIAEGNRVVVRARMKGRHEGTMNGIPPTFKDVEIHCVIGYEIENDMIINHWLSADQMQVLEQLGITPEVAK